MASSKDLKALAKDFAALSGLTMIVGKRVALKLAPMIDRQFDEGLDPYGHPWEALAEATIAKGRQPPPLTDTGEMRGTLDVKAKGNDIVVSLEEPAQFHQYGTVNMPARVILPTDSVPDTWAKTIDDTVEEVAKQFPMYSKADK